jgi:hypothetical protein
MSKSKKFNPVIKGELSGKVRVTVEQEWDEKNVTDFLSDFCSVTDENSIHQKSKEIQKEYIEKGYKKWEAELIAEGWELALLNILKQK